MKKMRKFAGLLLAMVMVLSMALPVLAAGENYTITLKYPNAGHTYEAYQIFKGDLVVKDGVEILTHITWGDGVKNAADLGDAAAVAARLATDYTGEDKLTVDDLVEMVTLSDTKTTSTSAYNEEDELYHYTMTGLDAGYYLVKDKDESLDGKHDAYTEYIVQVVGDVEMAPKADYPTLEKKIDENGTLVDSNNAAVGDTVNYVLSSKVPNMVGYEEYIYIVTDTMSAGLTFNNDIVVKVGTQTLTLGDDYTITVTKRKVDGEEVDGGESFAVKILDFLETYKDRAGEEITITFSATINENAVIGVEGNPNGANLIYSNDPTYPKGEPGTPDEDKPHGVTPDDFVITYITGIDVFKVDQNNQKLTGAEFKLEGEKLKKVKVYGQRFVEDEAGTYYKLNDGTYTETAPTDLTKNEYASTTTKYVLEDFEEWVTSGENVEIKGYVDEENGNIRFDGLAAGTYKITEITTPVGYNKLENPILVEIFWEGPSEVVEGNEDAKWSYKYSLDNGKTWTEYNKDGSIKVERVSITVINNKGTTLPETGGMGTTLFYVIGATLAIGAAVVMVTRKRMSAN